MQISLDTELLYFLAGAAVIWLLLFFGLEPGVRKRLLATQSNGMSRLAGYLAGLQVLRAVAAAAVVAAALVAVGTVALRWYMSDVPASDDGVATIVAIRDALEGTVDWTRAVSLEVWVAALFVLALIWLMVARSGSRRRWSAAVEARRGALLAALSGTSGEDLRARALEADAQGLEALEGAVEAVREANARIVAEHLNAPILSMGDDPDAAVSFTQIKELEGGLRARAAAIDPSGEAQPGAETDEEEEASPEELIAFADRLKAQIAELEQSHSVDLVTLEGGARCSLADVQADHDSAIGLRAQIERVLRNITVEAQLRSHDHAGLSKARREPELLHEWIAAGASGEVAVRVTSWLGRQSARVALVAVFLGLVTLGAREAGPALIGQAQALEVALNARVVEQDLTNALARASAEEPSEPAQAEDLASDAETVERLRSAFRSNLARSVQTAMRARQGSAFAMSHRQRYQLAAIEARQRILAATSRSTGASLERSAGGHATRARIPDPPSSVRAMEEVLDDALDRRIAALRSNERVWHRLRASAARPATPDFVAGQMMRTAFANEPLAGSHAMRVWAERTTGDFATAAARAREIPHDLDFTHKLGATPDLMSARDRRLIADFRSHAPQRVAGTLDDIRSGRFDPGSLHRGPPVRPGFGRGGAAAAGVYADLFPAAAQGATSSFGGGGGGGGVERTRPAGRTVRRATARSYARVRFSGRVGGVVLGRMPEEGGAELDITAVDWRLNGENRLVVSLTTAGGAPVTIGDFHPAIVHHALAYAADGRVVTSTLPQPTQSEPSRLGGHHIDVPARRVVVHPAFEDTAFACPAIQIDRFVDSFVYADSAGPLAKEIAAGRRAVTALGGLIQIARFAEDPRAAERIFEYMRAIAPYATACGVGEPCFPIETYRRYGFDFGETPAMLGCLAEEKNPTDCVPLIDRIGQRTTYLVDSGVRETSFKLDERLDFLTGLAHRSDPLWPMDFIVQAVPLTLSGEDFDAGDDWEPWSFPALRAGIRELVAEGIAADANAAKVFADMREFVVLQRLFRVSLNGDLGANFPLEALVGIQRATAPFVRARRHEHWNYNDGFFETLIREQEGLLGALASTGDDPSEPEECKSFVQDQLSAADRDPWPRGVGFWPTVGETREHCGGANAADVNRRVVELRRLDLIDEAIYFARNRGPQARFACAPL